jgi:hypothetical protein
MGGCFTNKQVGKCLSAVRSPESPPEQVWPPSERARSPRRRLSSAEPVSRRAGASPRRSARGRAAPTCRPRGRPVRSQRRQPRGFHPCRFRAAASSAWLQQPPPHPPSCGGGGGGRGGRATVRDERARGRRTGGSLPSHVGGSGAGGEAAPARTLAPRRATAAASRGPATPHVPGSPRWVGAGDKPRRRHRRQAIRSGERGERRRGVTEKRGCQRAARLQVAQLGFKSLT